MVTLALLAAVSAWYGYTVLDESLLFDSRAATPLQTPMWIPQGSGWRGSACSPASPSPAPSMR